MSERVHVLSARDPAELDALRRHAPAGIEIVWVDVNRPLVEQAEELRDAVVVIANPYVFPVELAIKCQKLRLVQTTSAGTNLLDVAALNGLGILVANNGGGNSVAVAEHTIALIVGAYRKLHLQFDAVRTRRWRGDLRDKWYTHSYELTNKTVGIVGLGRIGQAVARRLQGWDCRLIYYDVADFAPDLDDALHVTRFELDELLCAADIVTLHVPLNRITKAMIGDREFDLMKRTAILINTCRGPVVDEAALIRALRANKIAAAGLDVLEEEPPDANNPLLEMDNVLITPHLAALAHESLDRSRAFAIQNAARVVRSESAQSVVDPVW